MTPAGDLLEAETYNKMFTMHGISHGLFRAHPGDSRVLGNFLIPLDDRRAGCRLPAAQSGELVRLYARRNAGSYRGTLSVESIPDGRSTPPTVRCTRIVMSSSLAMGAFTIGFSSILTGLNFIVTTHTMRAPGMTWFRLAVVYLGPLCHESHPSPGDASDCHHACF